MCSATGRGTNRDPKDFYATPRTAFAPLLRMLPTDVEFHDPCAGDGRLLQWMQESGRVMTGADLFPQPDETLGYWDFALDYLQDPILRDFVITNPPFSIAFEIAQHARRTAKEFMLLLRLSFLESEERGDWLAANEPSALFVLRKRPQFVMSVTCKSVINEELFGIVKPRVCKHNWLLPIEAERPKVCPKCDGTNLSISTSDNSGYAWFYWGDRFKGIHHI